MEKAVVARGKEGEHSMETKVKNTFRDIPAAANENAPVVEDLVVVVLGWARR